MGTKTVLQSTKFLSLVPAGGMGTRLGILTARRAKPALAIGFDADGKVRRMIDVPLEAISNIGGAALVTTRFAPETLDFVNAYPNVQTRKEDTPGSPVDSLVGEIALLEATEASTIGIIPGDAYVTTEMLEEMYDAFDNGTADAAILATRHLKGHNVRPISGSGLLTTHGSS